MRLEDGLEQFKSAMLQKFQARDERHGSRSVTIAGDTLLREHDVEKGLWRHFEAEVVEFRLARDTNGEAEEAIDVANMAFLLWWRAQQ